MSKLLRFDKKHYNSLGLIPLKVGDDWVLEGEVVQKSGNYETPVDLTGLSSTGWFPGNTADITVTPVLTVPEDGKLKLVVPASATLDAVISEQGTSCYLTIDLTLGLTTVEMVNPDLEIKDRGYQLF